MDLVDICELKNDEFKSKILKLYFENNMKVKDFKVTFGEKMYKLQSEGLKYEDGEISLTIGDPFIISVSLDGGNYHNSTLNHEVNLEIIESKKLFEWDIVIEANDN